MRVTLLIGRTGIESGIETTWVGQYSNRLKCSSLADGAEAHLRDSLHCARFDCIALCGIRCARGRGAQCNECWRGKPITRCGGGISNQTSRCANDQVECYFGKSSRFYLNSLCLLQR